jgi:hypothetical protein
MIYAPNSALDKQLLSHSRTLVRKAMSLLRKSDHLVSAQRLRAELEEDRPREDRQKSGPDRGTDR